MWPFLALKGSFSILQHFPWLQQGIWFVSCIWEKSKSLKKRTFRIFWRTTSTKVNLKIDRVLSLDIINLWKTTCFAFQAGSTSLLRSTFSSGVIVDNSRKKVTFLHFIRFCFQKLPPTFCCENITFSLWQSKENFKFHEKNLKRYCPKFPGKHIFWVKLIQSSISLYLLHAL